MNFLNSYIKLIYYFSLTFVLMITLSHILGDMTDVVELNGAIRDEVQTYTMQEIFEALQPNIVSVPQFRDEVLMRNNFKEQMPMGVLFGDYGF